MRYLVFFVTFLIAFGSFGQNPKLDQLEMWFDQGHYKKVHRKSDRLMDDPEYDFSQLPKYYKSLSLMQLCQNNHWRTRHPKALTEAQTLLTEVKSSEDGLAIFGSHKYELSWVKSDLISWASDLKRVHSNSEFQQVQTIIDKLFGEIEIMHENEPEVTMDSTAIVGGSGIRNEIVALAKQQLGVPYVWAGSSPEGFDCSGFTTYIMKQKGRDLPRRAADQYNESTKLKEKDVQKGDLIFFNNGSGISHVGIVISERGQPIQMIHSASSKGIIVTDVSKSTYWSSRIHGYGTYL